MGSLFIINGVYISAKKVFHCLYFWASKWIIFRVLVINRPDILRFYIKLILSSSSLLLSILVHKVYKLPWLILVFHNITYVCIDHLKFIFGNVYRAVIYKWIRYWPWFSIFFRLFLCQFIFWPKSNYFSHWFNMGKMSHNIVNQ